MQDIALAGGTFAVVHGSDKATPVATYGAVDESGKLNVNTATSLVLASLLPNLSPDDVPVDGSYESLADFKEVFPGGDQIPAAIPLDIRSSWFLLTATASIGTVQSTMYSLLQRDGEVVRTRLRTFDAN